MLHSTLHTKVAEGTKEGALWFHLRRLVNDSLKDNVQVQLQKLDGPPELVTRPTNLLGFMWLQLAQEITGIRQRRICRQCGKGFWLYERGGGPAPDSERRNLLLRALQGCGIPEAQSGEQPAHGPVTGRPLLPVALPCYNRLRETD